jgi:hypothetical protein
MSRTQQFRRAAWLLAAALANACTPDSPTLTDLPGVPLSEATGVAHPRAAAALEAVLAANSQAVDAAPYLVPPGVPLPPFVEARLYAIASVAVHDALNAIVPRFERYADDGPVVGNASLAVAALTAARDAIAGAAPPSQAAVDSWYQQQISAFAGSPGYAQGVSVGQRAAAAILQLRSGDGTIGGGVAPYVAGAQPGDYRFTFPFNTPAFDFFGTGGFADASAWGASVTPFVVPGTSQFRAPPPYGQASNTAAVQTAQYSTDYAEVKALGCAGCGARSAEQTEIALFWVENSPTGWNRIVRVAAAQRQLDAWETARLLALLQMGQFDVYATNLESKYFYNFWRPVTAVELAGGDGNPATEPAAGWEVLAFPTPPVPDYPSAHAAAGGAAASIVEAVIPGRGPAITVHSGSLPGVTRTFASLAQAANENAMSRIYVGYHFRHAAEVGLDQGRTIGDYIAANALSRLR